MKFTLYYSAEAISDLDNLNFNESRKIISKLDFYIVQTDPMKFAKTLQGELKGLFRFRIGNYRVIFSKDSKGHITILTVIRIKHRKEVYE